jgi:hypothetical protein
MSKIPCGVKLKELIYRTFFMLGMSGIGAASVELLALILSAIYIRIIKLSGYTTKGVPEDFLKSVRSQKRAM